MQESRSELLNGSRSPTTPLGVPRPSDPVGPSQFRSFSQIGYLVNRMNPVVISNTHFYTLGVRKRVSRPVDSRLLAMGPNWHVVKEEALNPITNSRSTLQSVVALKLLWQRVQSSVTAMPHIGHHSRTKRRLQCILFVALNNLAGRPSLRWRLPSTLCLNLKKTT